MNKPYSNRELDMRFSSVEDKMESGFKDICDRMTMHNANTLERLDAINEKLGIQNGRVRKLENWRSWMVGGMAGIMFAGGWFLTNSL